MSSLIGRLRLVLAVLLGIAAGFLVLGGCAAGAAARVTPGSTTGQSYYVAPDGDDTGPGSASAPWKTIQHAADVLQPGDTVYVRGGVYSEAVAINVSGSADGGYITFTNYPGETPILDGSDFADDPDGANGFYIESRSYLVIRGFEIRNYTTTLRDAVPMGIQIVSASHHIRLLDNYIHHIETHAPPDANLLGADAHGIAVYGDATQPISHLLIAGNEVSHLLLGSSEAVALNGNVTVFTVTDNLIHDCDNIGLALIGFEDVAPDPALDRARDGLVSGNRVYGVDSRSNPAYGGERSAGGIYVDGGTRIVIERNTVYSANIGVELASEHAGGDASHITLRNNLIYHNHVAGIALGGYDPERGSTYQCAVVNNTLYQNDGDEAGNGEIWLQFAVRDNLIANNIVWAGEQGLFITNPYTQNSGNVVDYNLYFSPIEAAGSRWQWRTTTYTGFTAYRSGSGNDAHSLFGDPQLDVPSLHLTEGSPAIDAGTSLTQAGAVDFDGEPRVVGAGIDIGADEYQATGRTTAVYLPLVMRSVDYPACGLGRPLTEAYGG